MTTNSKLYFLGAFAGAAALLLGAGLAQVWLRHVGHDQAWCLYAADLMLKGVTLDGPKLVEVNPPFIIWFSCIPVLLGHILKLTILDGFRLFFDLVCLASIAYSTQIYRKSFQTSPIFLLCFALCQIVVDFWLIRKDSLGQREQFLFLFVLPYVVIAAARFGRVRASVSDSIISGLLAAVAFSLKPQHLITLMCIELFLVVANRDLKAWFNLAFGIASAGIVLYLIAVVFLGTNYLRNVVPLLSMTYSAMNHPYSQLLTPTAWVIAGAFTLCTAYLLIQQAGGTLEGVATLFSVATVGSFVAYLQQHKGWSYQLIPAGLFAAMLCSSTLMSIANKHVNYLPNAEQVSVRRLPSACAFLLVSAFSLAFALHYSKRPDYYVEKKRTLAKMFNASRPGAAVTYIATEPWEMPLVIEQHKVLGQRANYFWLLPAVIIGSDPANRTAALDKTSISHLEEYQRETAADDLLTWKPEIVVFDQCGPNLCQSLQREGHPNLLSWFMQSDRFRAAWIAYQPLARDGDLEAFQRR